LLRLEIDVSRYLNRRENPVLHSDNQLLHHIIESFNDPDPDRALRPRPFVYGSVRRRLAAESLKVTHAPDRTERRVAILFKAVRRIEVRGRASAIPACEPACC
jgi:hypothetical protein